jgi:hypothetical protein
MQVPCAKCSKPIALTDIIESHDGELSHVDCKRPQVLTREERALVFLYCSEHVVARCLPCYVSYRYTDLAAEMVGGSRTNMCPRCRQDLTEAVRAHLFRCATLPWEIRLRTKAVREASRHLVEQSQELRDQSDVLIREAEVALSSSRRALREAMARRSS